MTEVSTSPRLERRASELVSRSDRSFLVRAAHAPATWLVILVGVSALVRFAIVSRVAAPWILPDEIVYSELAAAFLRIAMPRITASGMRSPPIEKWCSERWVWAPQYRSAGTSIGPMLSDSVRVGPVAT
jgi:hypothetical protein